ncbi:MAG: flagellar basal body-associated FliL family protein [Candidatus Eisenbacteria bacterium]|uniref:Flagellar protein FliL n=1 Tax=Eiseniibacteriota bacterium TaxID=2212470 RepID=A0A956SBL8_UNCEI|nr:flagellar basal body-associated FliL family protein [Candidatus Eisenbacteria bacterium]
MSDEKKAADAAPEPAKKGPLPPMVVKIAILAGILVVVAAAAVFVVVEVVAPKLGGGDTAEVVEGEEGAAGEHGEAASEHGEKKEEKKEKKEEKGGGGHGGGGEEGGGGHEGIVDLGDLVVNPAGTGGRRYLKVQVQVELEDPDESGLVESKTPKLRDRIIRELTSRTLSELTDPVAKDEMKETIIDEMNRILGGDIVDDMYFTEYVIQ